MSHKYFKPVVKFVSRKTAIEKLDLTEKQFDRLTVLIGIYPVIAEAKNCYDKIDGWYYKIDDIKRIFYSESYGILRKNTKNDKKRVDFMKFNQIERAARVIDDEYDLVDLVRNKYNSLGKSVEDLGNTLRNMYLIDLLAIDDIRDDLRAFEEFVVERRMLNRAFMSKKGIYFGLEIEKIIVAWMVPYPGTGLKELVEEKAEQPREAQEFDFDFLDFGSMEFDESEEALNDPNDPSKRDISLLKYASPLLKIHLKLMIHKFRLLYSEQPSRPRIFRNTKFCVDIGSIPDQIAFVIRCCGGETAPLGHADIVVTESVETIDNTKRYLQPQYVFDSLNQGKALDMEAYLVGKTLPVHKSPFPNILDTLDSRALRMLSNKKKYSILDRVEAHN